MEDIDLARSLLEEEKWNLVIVKGGQVLVSSRERGIVPFFQAVQSMGKSLHNAAVADRIVGLAVAMLCLYVGVASVYAGIASEGALDMLRGQGVTVTSKNIVPHISNYDGTGLCPFEKMAKDSQNPAQLLSALKSIFGGHNYAGEPFT
ncbi:MAG: DUF1893 domain-containing protein [Chloroflexi bacterium]|nr:DUF1893 domain-containing protein [Chloroflexota bacterium]